MVLHPCLYSTLSVLVIPLYSAYWAISWRRMCSHPFPQVQAPLCSSAPRGGQGPQGSEGQGSFPGAEKGEGEEGRGLAWLLGDLCPTSNPVGSGPASAQSARPTPPARARRAQHTREEQCACSGAVRRRSWLRHRPRARGPARSARSSLAPQLSRAPGPLPASPPAPRRPAPSRPAPSRSAPPGRGSRAERSGVSIPTARPAVSSRTASPTTTTGREGGCGGRGAAQPPQQAGGSGSRVICRPCGAPRQGKPRRLPPPSAQPRRPRSRAPPTTWVGLPGLAAQLSGPCARRADTKESRDWSLSWRSGRPWSVWRNSLVVADSHHPITYKITK